MNILIIGPQGSGKGTQAEKIAQHYQLDHIEMGGLIRDKAEGHSQKAHIIDHLANQKGQLLPDGIIIDLLLNHLEDTNFKPFLLDGFPRTLKQYSSLKEILEEANHKLTTAIYLKISDQESLKRLTKRGREDDKPEIINKRLENYHQNTQPILDELKKDNLLVEVNGEQEINNITKDIFSKLDSLNR